MFNHRRVSRDAVVTDRILKLAAEHGPLNITPYTLRLLPQENIPSCVVHICDHPAAEGKGTCWLESQEEFPGKSHKKITMEVYHRA